MNVTQHPNMKKLILTGTYAQYRDWLVLHNANPRAALYIHRPDQFCGMDPEQVEIVLGDCYWDNPAYMSTEYLHIKWRQNHQIAI